MVATKQRPRERNCGISIELVLNLQDVNQVYAVVLVAGIFLRYFSRSRSELVVLFSHIIGNHSLNSRINVLRYEYGVIDFGELIERQQPPKRLQFALVQPPPPNKSNNSREMVAFLLYDHINLVKAQPITVM